MPGSDQLNHRLTSKPFIQPSPNLSFSRLIKTPKLHLFRDRDDSEVDIVLERGRQEVPGIEVKAAATVTAADFRGMRKLKEAAGKRFKGGVVLYDGEATAPFGDGLYAVPIRQLWEGA